MEVVSITPAVKVVKEDNMAGVDMYLAFGDKIKVVDYENNEYRGSFLFMELGKDVEEDDSLVLDCDGKNVSIQCSYIKNIVEQ